jgi:hypothetical protein
MVIGVEFDLISERRSYQVLDLGRLVVLMALGDDPLMLLHGGDETLDDSVELFAHVVLDIHLLIHHLVGYCLLEQRCFRR